MRAQVIESFNPKNNKVFKEEVLLQQDSAVISGSVWGSWKRIFYWDDTGYAAVVLTTDGISIGYTKGSPLCLDTEEVKIDYKVYRCVVPGSKLFRELLEYLQKYSSYAAEDVEKFLSSNWKPRVDWERYNLIASQTPCSYIPLAQVREKRQHRTNQNATMKNAFEKEGIKSKGFSKRRARLIVK